MKCILHFPRLYIRFLSWRNWASFWKLLWIQTYNGIRRDETSTFQMCGIPIDARSGSLWHRYRSRRCSCLREFDDKEQEGWLMLPRLRISEHISNVKGRNFLLHHQHQLHSCEGRGLKTTTISRRSHDLREHADNAPPRVRDVWERGTQLYWKSLIPSVHFSPVPDLCGPRKSEQNWSVPGRV